MDHSEPQGQSPKHGGGIRIHTITLVVSCVLLVIAAFVVGVLVASQATRNLSTETADVSETEDVSGEDTQGENDVPGLLTDGVLVSWYETDDWQERDGNFYIRRWWESFNDAETLAMTEYAATIMGEIRNKDYEGYYLVANSIQVATLGGANITIYTIEPQKSDVGSVLLRKYAVNEPMFSSLVTSIADQITEVDGMTVSDEIIAELEVPESLTSIDGTATFMLLGVGARAEGEYEYGEGGVTVTTKEGKMLREQKERSLVNEFVWVRPDNRPVWYDLEVIFWEMADWSVTDDRAQIPEIVWADGTSPTDEYLKGYVNGCGFASMTHVPDVVPELVLAGHAVTDVDVQVFEPKDYRDPTLGDEYDGWKFWQLNADPNADISYEKFSKGHPVFFYKDVFGRWIEFTRADVIPAGECGKPVIYLYPEKTTQIDVHLAPQGGFTKTEPAYNGGWHVVAQPDGTLTNLADGLTYPYLFWEGRGGLYSAPNRYWVVARADVHTFLVSTLAKLGLNEQETADFMEFWEPRMQAAPFYKIGFHGTNVMDQIAPMTLSQTPDTVLRILMDYSELSAPIPQNPPMLPQTPVRNGFTVIEWGGVIR